MSTPASNRAVTTMPGSSWPLGLGTVARSVTAPVPRSTLTPLTVSSPFCAYTVPSSSTNCSCVAARAPFKLAAQLQQLGTALHDVDLHRVELLHGGQGLGLVGGDQRPRGDRGDLDAAADRRTDARPVDLHLGGGQGGARHRHLGLGLQPSRGAVVRRLAADRIGLEQFGVAGCAAGCHGGLRLGLLQRGGRAGALGLEAGGVELVERLAGFHGRRLR